MEKSGFVEAALTENRDSSLAADVLLAHLYLINPREGLRLAVLCSVTRCLYDLINPREGLRLAGLYC